MKRFAPTLPRTLLINMVVIVTVSVGLFILLSLAFESWRLDEERTDLDRNHREPLKQELKRQVDGTVAFVAFKRSKLEKQAEEELRQRVLEAHAIASHIVKTYGATKSPQELQSLVREALRPIRFAGGKGYFFATRLDGVEQLFADRPAFEGQNLLTMQDTEGRYVIRDMIKLARRQDEGLYRYTWSKPDKPGTHYRKISYIKRFAPFNWFIGTGLYLDDVEQQLKSEVLAYIEQIRFGSDGYIFAAQWDGLSLSGPAKGKNMLAVTDANGNRVVERLISLARQGGGYLSYHMPDLQGVRQGVKLSYVQPIKDWQWYIGAGVYTEDIEAAVRQARQEMLLRLFRTVSILVFVLICFVSFAVWTSRRAAQKIAGALEQFSRFFVQAETGAAYLDPASLPFEELQTIARAANHMVEERKRIEEDIQQQAHRLALEVAERQAAQESLAVSKQALEEINATLEERVAAEVAANVEKNRIMFQQGRLAAMGETMASIAHQWRQPLNNLAIMLQSLLFDHERQELDRATLEQQVGIGMEMVTYLSKTIDDFRNFFLPDQAQQAFAIMPALRKGVALVQDGFAGYGVALQVSDADVGSTVGYPHEFARAVLSIITNAKEACLERQVANPTVTLMAERRGSCVVITISDNAGGVSPEIMERIFDPYFTTKQKSQGTGLGLYIAKMVIEKNMGGRLSVANSAHGAVFRIELPAGGAALQ